MNEPHRVGTWIDQVRLEHKEERMNRVVPAPFEARYLNCEIMPHGVGLPLPQHQTTGSSGVDLYAAIDGEIVLQPGKMAMVPTGLKVAIYPGFEGQVRSRSGLAVKHQVTIMHGVGTIDADYRGEMFVPLFNHGENPFVINRGDRVAQMIVAPYQPVEMKVVESLDQTVRGEGGFGHTG